MYDDNDPDEKQGAVREPEEKRHTKAILYIDLDHKNSLAASASEDGTVVLMNNWNHRMEGRLEPPIVPGESFPPVSICKFIVNTDCDLFRSAYVIVTADIDGYLNFYAVDGVLRNTLLCRKRILNEAEQI